jgi:uncharacterized protein (DUF2164 family)
MKEIGLLDKDQRKMAIEAIMSFFQNERDEEIGIIAAEEVLDFFLNDIGTAIYNKGVDDAKATLRKLVDGLEVDLGALTRQ